MWNFNILFLGEIGSLETIKAYNLNPMLPLLRVPE